MPAYFDAAQREATRVAAALAGLDSIELLAEPVAACLAHRISDGGATPVTLTLALNPNPR